MINDEAKSEKEKKIHCSKLFVNINIGLFLIVDLFFLLPHTIYNYEICNVVIFHFIDLLYILNIKYVTYKARKTNIRQ